MSDQREKTRSEPCPVFPAGPHVLSDPRFGPARARGEKRRGSQKSRHSLEICPECHQAALQGLVRLQEPLPRSPGPGLVSRCPECRHLRLDSRRALERAQWLLREARQFRELAEYLLDLLGDKSPERSPNE